MATTLTDTTVSVVPWIKLVEPYIQTVLSIVVTAIIGWAANRFSAATGIKIEATHRAALHSAVISGVNAGLVKFDTATAGATIDVKSEIVKDAVEWAQTSVPDAIKYLGATPDAIATLASAKLGDVLTSAPVTLTVPKS